MTQFGALHPAERAWQIGKNVASISFVNYAMKYIEGCKDTIRVGALTDRINAIKTGKVVLTVCESPHQYLHKLEK